MVQHGTLVVHGKYFYKLYILTNCFREDKKLKIDVVKQTFTEHFVEKEWTCKKGEFKAIEVETLTGEVIKTYIEINV
jgi:hypothetical protein